ncbi:MAG: hypothetical protein ACK2UV_06625, partial [Candidatus Promineifilaceae bacterium]
QVFSELAKAAPQYKGMNYRTLARVETQWPIVDGHDAYYQGNVIANRFGMGQQWPATAAADSGEVFEAGEQVEAAAVEGLQVVRVAALFTAGTLINHSEVIAPRLARPTLILNSADASELGFVEGDHASVMVNGLEYRTYVAVVDVVERGLALMRGVPYFAGRLEAVIEKFEIVEKEMVV